MKTMQDRNIPNIAGRVIVALGIAVLLYFCPGFLYKLLFSFSFRMSCSAIIDEIIARSFALFTIILLAFVFRKILTKRNLFCRINSKQLIIIPLNGLMIPIILGSIGRLVPRILEDRFQGLEPFQIVLFILLYAPIVEEFVMRGIILTYLRPLSLYRIKIFRIHLSVPVLISSILFEVMHFSLNTTYSPVQLIWLLVSISIGGLFFGYWFEKTRNIFIPILCHFVFNLPTALIIIFRYVV